MFILKTVAQSVRPVAWLENTNYFLKVKVSQSF